VVADTGSYRKDVWREIRPHEYDSFDMSADLQRPLRAVGVVAGWESQTRVGTEFREPGPVFGGCYVGDPENKGDGSILYVSSPPWLRSIQTQPGSAAVTMGVKADGPARSSTTADADPGKADTTGQDVRKMYDRFAQTVYVNNSLRGRTGALSGKLRFDIAPLSMVRVKAESEKFIGAEDDLAATIVGCVQRVTVSINAEAGMAGTTFVLSHVRSRRRTSPTGRAWTQHPLFGDGHPRRRQARVPADGRVRVPGRRGVTP
jgi:hypothetical protein